MPSYKFTGSEWNVGGRLLKYGDEVELPAAPNRMFVDLNPVQSPEVVPVETHPSKRKGICSVSGVRFLEEIRDYAMTVPQGHAYSVWDAVVLYEAVCDALRGCEHGTVLEFAGGTGGSTFIIGLAIRDSGVPTRFYSCERDIERHDFVRKALEASAASGCDYELWKGDIYAYTERIQGMDLDVFVADTSHSLKATNWYVDTVWPRVRSGGRCFVHDIAPICPGGEKDIVLSDYEKNEFKLVHLTCDEEMPSRFSSFHGHPFNVKGDVGCVLQKGERNA